MSKQLMDRKELAAWFKVSIPTVDRWIRDGAPCLRPSPGVIRFNLEDVVAWSKAGGADTTATAGHLN